MIFTSFTPSHFELNDKTLYLWKFSLASHLPQSDKILNTEEKKRAQRFYFEKHQRRFATARTRIREILGHYLEIAPQDLQFIYGKQGKPEIVNNRNLHFNLSHTGELGILAVSTNPVGVDIERYSKRPYAGMSENLFSVEEKKALREARLYEKPALFFRIWSLKEAFIKANGLGLSYPLQKISVPLNHFEPVILEDHLYQQSWKIMHFMSDIAISAAFCCHPETEIFHFNNWPRE